MNDGNEKEPVVLTMDWDAEDLALAKQAASLKSMSVEAFIREQTKEATHAVLKARKMLMDLASAADYLGVSRGDVVRLISKGTLKARKIDDDWFVDQNSAKLAFQEEGLESLDHIELDIQQICDHGGLAGVDLDGPAPTSVTATWCYVSQDGVLHCPKVAWKRLGRDAVVSSVRDAVARFVRRREAESG